MTSSFFERTDELAQMVGDGELVGTCEVSQIYAAYQLPSTTGLTCTTLAAVRRFT